jgi:hypothetical protein
LYLMEQILKHRIDLDTQLTDQLTYAEKRKGTL